MTYNTEQSLIPIAFLCLSLAVLSHIRGSNFRNFFLTSFGYFILARGYYWYKGTLDFNSFILATLTFLSAFGHYSLSPSMKIYTKYSGFTFLFLLIAYSLYEKIQIEMGIDTVQYKSESRLAPELQDNIRKSTTSLMIGSVSLLAGLVGNFGIYRNIYSWVYIRYISIVLMIIGGISLFWYFFYGVDDNPDGNLISDYAIRRKASTSEFFERRDMDSGIYA
tara:strand:+ start:510 stop:1172 length:663 start_codon:yes stop_codon:yes gene_type:complete